MCGRVCAKRLQFGFQLLANDPRKWNFPVTNLYRTSQRRPHGSQHPDTLSSTIEAFLNTCRKPAVLDYGDEPLSLLSGHYVLECRAGKLLLEAWDENRSLSRRILGIEHASTGILDCSVQRFGGKPGTLTFLDLERPQTAARFTRGVRQTFAEQFRRTLSRQFPAWEVKTLSSSLDLRRSFSSTFPRARLSRGTQNIAAIACPSAAEESAFLTSALLWFDYLSGRSAPGEQLSLCLFLPDDAGTLSAHRLRWLQGRRLRTQLFLFNQHGMAGEVDPKDLGNVETHVTTQYVPVSLTPELQALASHLGSLPGVGCCPEVNGSLSIRFHGLEFARLTGHKLFLGIDSQAEVPASEANRLISFAEQLMATASVPKLPERWLESAVRANIPLFDPELLAAPVHGQVLTSAAGEREVIDLLAITTGGRLTVLELKAVEDLQLPMQALDYWIHIGWHAQRGELSHLFPTTPIAPTLPKLLLVAPALSFHPSNEIVLRYFSPEIEVERVGVNSDWESTLQVAFRLRGAELPISHQRTR